MHFMRALCRLSRSASVPSRLTRRHGSRQAAGSMLGCRVVHHSPPLPVLVRRAIKTHNLTKLRYALDYNADLSEADSQGRTPFHLAATSAVAMVKAQADNFQPLCNLMRGWHV